MSKTDDQIKAAQLKLEANKLLKEAEALELKNSQSLRDRQIEQFASTLSERAANVFRWLAYDHVTNTYLMKNIEDFCLQKDTDKPYYLYCFWDNGSNGYFVTESEAKDTIAASFPGSDDERFECILFDVGNEVEIDFEVDIKVLFKKES